MNSRLRSYFFILLALVALVSQARAQVLPAPPAAAPAATASDATTTLNGRVETAKGPLGGAVVRLVRTKQTCVTNAEGIFFFTVPADAGPLAAVASYNGTADVPFTLQPIGQPTVVKLGTPKLAKADQKQLKARIKRANRESKRSLQQLK